MAENMTLCPDCGTEFETVGATEDDAGILQAMHQQCPDCGYEVEVSIINYPDGRFTVLAPALDGDTCAEPVPTDDTRFGHDDCGDDADIRLQTIGEPVEGRCSEHIHAHHQSAVDLRMQL